MQSKLVRCFPASAAAILLATATAKTISGFGSAEVLEQPDPILGISFRSAFFVAGTIELAVGLICLFAKCLRWQTGLVAWLATIFVVYRLGLVLVGYKQPCNCLGGFTDALHITPGAADAAMKCILAYLLLVSYVVFFVLWQPWKGRVVVARALGTTAAARAGPLL